MGRPPVLDVLDVSDARDASGPAPAARGAVSRSWPRPAAVAPSSAVAGRGGRVGDERVTRVALAAGRGDAGAMEEFVRATRADVWRFVAYLVDVESADDLTQETYVRALRSLPGFAGRSSARQWLLSIARRAVTDQFRRAARVPWPVAPLGGQLGGERRVVGAVTTFDEEVVLADLVRSVERGRREAFVLTQVVGLSYAEVAEVLGCPVGTVRSRVARARGELHAALRAAEAAGGGVS